MQTKENYYFLSKLALFIACFLSVNSCNKSLATSYIKDNVAKFLEVKNSDLNFLGSDFSRGREPVVVYEINYDLISPSVKSLLNSDLNSLDADRLKRINHYLRSVNLSEVEKSYDVSGYTEKSESNYSFILIRINENLMCIYLGGI